jgi:hypothetical protein
MGWGRLGFGWEGGGCLGRMGKGGLLEGEGGVAAKGRGRAAARWERERGS